MKRIRSEKLTRTRPGTSTVTEHVTIELFELPADAGHVVHLSSSRDGLQWRETVLTPAPLALDKAMAVFGDALTAQLARGLALEGAPLVASAPATPATASPSAADTLLLNRIAPDAWRLLPPQRPMAQAMQ